MNGLLTAFSSPRAPVFALAVVLAASIVFGGGGANFGILNLLVQGAVLLALAFHFEAIVVLWRSLSLFGRFVICITICLPLIQAIPLPPSVWQNLAGRELVQASFEAMGGSPRWFSLSIDSRRTLLAASALIVPFGVLVLSSAIPASGKKVVLHLILALVVVSLAVGAVQLLSGNEFLSWYPNRDNDELYALFANHNSSGLFFVIALCCLAPLDARSFGKRLGSIIFYAFAAALVIATILTQSRSSTALLLLPLLLFAYFALKDVKKVNSRALVATVAAGAVASVFAVYLVFSNSKLAQTFSRFDDLTTSRPGIWSDTLAAIEQFWPVGSGIGSYRDVFETFESLERVNPLTPGRAHNDYLEFALEAGILGIMLLFVWLVFICLLYARARKQAQSRTLERMPVACMVAFLAIALQSAIDYPLRNLALLSVAAALLGTMIIPSKTRGVREI